MVVDPDPVGSRNFLLDPDSDTEKSFRIRNKLEKETSISQQNAQLQFLLKNIPKQL
jgi:hypothetical protein